MTAKSLHNFSVRNALRVVKQNMKMTIVTCILYFLGAPMIMFSLMMELILESRDVDELFSPVLYCVIGGFCLTAAVFMGMIAAINSFTELHSKTKVDMLYSLPLTGRQRFFSDYIGGCCMYLLPYVASMLLGWVVILVMYPFIAQADPEIYWSGVSLGEIAKYYALSTFGLLALMMLYYALSALVTVCCGTLFECIYTNLLLNLLIPGTMAAILGVISANVDLDFLYMWQMIGFMSPVGGLIYLIYLISDPYSEMFSITYSRIYAATQTTEHAMLPAYLRWIFAIVIISVLLTVVAWQLYVRRKAEHVGKPFVYVAAYYVMLTLITVSILCIMSVGSPVFGPVLLFAAIVYFVMEIIRKRGFRRFWLSVITYVVTVGVSVGMFGVIVYSGCFGRVYYVPPSVTIRSVAIQMPVTGNSYYDIGLEYTDKDMISAVTGLHREWISLRKDGDAALEIDTALTEKKLLKLNYDNYHSGDYSNNRAYYLQSPGYRYDSDDRYSFLYGGYEEDYNYSAENYLRKISDGKIGEYTPTMDVEINYYTISGSVIHRRYYVNPDEYRKILEIVQGTELYAEALSNGMESKLRDQFSEWSSKTRTYSIPSETELNVTYQSSAYYDDTVASHRIKIKNTENVIVSLADAYKKDLTAMTAEQFRTAPIKCYLYSIPVYETCTQTLDLLKSYGFKDFTVAERYGFDGESSYYYDDNKEIAIRIYAPGTFSAASLEYPSTVMREVFFQNDNGSGTPAYEDSCESRFLDNDMRKLMEVAQGNYVSAEECYALVVNGTVYMVPEKYSDRAKTVIDKGSFYLRGGGDGSAWVDDTWSDYFSDEDWWFDDDDDSYVGGGGGGAFVPFDPDWDEEFGYPA